MRRGAARQARGRAHRSCGESRTRQPTTRPSTPRASTLPPFSAAGARWTASAGGRARWMARAGNARVHAPPTSTTNRKAGFRPADADCATMSSKNDGLLDAAAAARSDMAGFSAAAGATRFWCALRPESGRAGCSLRRFPRPPWRRQRPCCRTLGLKRPSRRWAWRRMRRSWWRRAETVGDTRARAGRALLTSRERPLPAQCSGCCT